MVGAIQEVDIIGSDGFEAELFGPLNHLPGGALLRLHAVVMDFEVKVGLAEDVSEFADAFFRFVFAVREQEFVDLTIDAAAEADEAFTVGGEGFFVDAWFVPHAVEVAFGDELGEVFKARVVGGEQGQVRGAFATGDFLLVVHGEGGQVGLAANDGIDLFGLGLLVEFNGAIEVAVIGHGHGGHAQFGNAVHQLPNPHGAIQERVFGVEVEVDEGVRHTDGMLAGRGAGASAGLRLVGF